MRRGLSSTVVTAAITALLAMLLLAWGAGSGTPLISEPQGTWGSPPPISLPQIDTEAATIPPPEPDGGEADVGPDYNQFIVDAIQIVMGLALLLLVAFLLRKMLSTRLEPRTANPADEDELIALLDATGEEVRFRALSEGDPRNAVVACWVALEEAVVSSGLRPDRTETAVELTRRVLSRWEVDEASITALSAAYREARFSRHPITEQQRESAVAALERIHEDLRRRVAAEQAAREEQEAAERARAQEQEQARQHQENAGVRGGGRGRRSRR